MTLDHSLLGAGPCWPCRPPERPAGTCSQPGLSPLVNSCSSTCCRVVGADGGYDGLLEASRDPTRKRLQGGAKLPSRFGLGRGSGRGSRSGSFSAGEEALAQDFSSKLLHLSWHPQANVIATAASNSLYLFYGGCFVGPAVGMRCSQGMGTFQDRLRACPLSAGMGCILRCCPGR